MGFGKLYSYPGNPRTIAIQAVANVNNLDLEFVHTEPAKGVSDDYKLINKLGLVPSFVGADNFTLTECIAIAIYLTSQNEKTTLLGKTKQDYASILRWMSFANSQVLPALGGSFRPLIGRDPYNKKSVDDNLKATAANVKVLEDHLLVNTYLVSERITLADIFAAGILSRGFQFFWDPEWRSQHPNVTRWFRTITSQDIYTAVVEKTEFCEKPLENKPPGGGEKKEKKEKKPAAPAAAPKPKVKTAAEAEEEEAAQPAAPKPKHPLELLGKPTFVLDDWKRKYSNDDTRESALPWFWENCKFDEFSIWRFDFKFNDELTMTFMSNNQIGGFFARLEASRKYIFGCGAVFGQTNDSVIQGAFVVRGQEAMPAFDVAPDVESYSFTKLDPSKPEDREFVNDMWAWDKPVVVNGKTMEFADGKVFK
ncbi:hypothetical protein WHR41_06850 [Cladosporium halotolerans]|uniref:Elongation factor 1-gamma n=1 Tax=Cladosporium halotolerans TaxID=1052096 RepID=A0AB34KLQ7_9PEZI